MFTQMTQHNSFISPSTLQNVPHVYYMYNKQVIHAWWF